MRRKSTYEAMQDLNGNWITDGEALERLIIDFFSDLFY